MPAGYLPGVALSYALVVSWLEDENNVPAWTMAQKNTGNSDKDVLAYYADTYRLYAHQNEDIVRLTPEQLKQKMAAKEAGNPS